MEGASAQYRYRAFGESVWSEIELWPGLAQQDVGHPSILVRLTGAPERVEGGRVSIGTHEAAIDWPKVASASVRSGRTLDLKPDPEADLQALALLVTGPLLAAALHQRGRLVLHGSSVAQPEGAVCFIGPSQAGKSTMAASLVRQGAVLLSDGMTVIAKDDQGNPWVLPGPPYLRLWPDAATALGWNVSALTRVTPAHDKYLVPQLVSSFAQSARLTHVYVLEEGQAASERLESSAALLAVLHNHYLASYAPRFSSELAFKMSGEVVSRVQVSRLRRGSSLGEVATVLGLVERSGDEVACEGRALDPKWPASS